MRNYGQLAFSEAAKILQQEFGSRKVYEQVEKRQVVEGLTDNEIRFIRHQDHFFIASIGENGYPYIQHRGGPPGFLKVLDPKTAAFIDFSGNRQYITTGNITSYPNVSLIMISYPYKARLKLYAMARILQLKEHPSLLAKIDLDGYQYKPERIIELKIEAFDWNCPQHITPRYTMEEVEQMFTSQNNSVALLKAENEKLKAEIENLKKKTK